MTNTTKRLHSTSKNTSTAIAVKQKGTRPVKTVKTKKSLKTKSLPVASSAQPTTVQSVSEAASQKPMTPVKPLICLVGDEGLVKEYSALFQEKGISVLELKSLSSLKTSARKISAAFELTLIMGDKKMKNLTALDEALPEHIPVISSSVTSTILTQTHSLRHPGRFIGIAAFPTLIANSLVELAPSLHTLKSTAETVTTLFTSVKKETALVQDSIGMVMPRILCQIINEALFTVQNDVASPNDIDEAMKHGTNYPHGPIAWGEQIGFSNVTGVLDAIYNNHHEERYRVAPLLRQMAIAGVFWEAKVVSTP